MKLDEMAGLFYYEDADGITFLFFFKGKRAISYNRYSRFGQQFHSFPEFSVESDTVYVSRGFYEFDMVGNMRIVINGYFKMEYRGLITDHDTLDLFCRCPFTWEKKSVIFVRCTERKNISQMELDDVCKN